MGTYVIVKVMEIGLLAALLLHAVLAIWLAVTNKMARPKGYHKPQRSKTHTGSKIQMWTGILIFACLIMHFTDFYFVKIGWVKGKYMAKTEDVVALKTTQRLSLRPPDLKSSPTSTTKPARNSRSYTLLLPIWCFSL